MYRPIDKSKIIKKPGQPSVPAPAPLYQVGYALAPACWDELRHDDAKVKRRTTATANLFKDRHLSALGDKVNLNVLDIMGMFTINSSDSSLLAALPKKFGSFERGEVERVVPKRPLRPLHR